ncbi:hypothetical protein FB45DRAFT_1018503 [Roridomyces roridus]|uniref:Rhodopsin domain-containing protein n=1 Tax=Roridomyces roridus TaxID=1738132 RepID=A0AAD7G1W9_9AGAR|nr:hypothetical protein FB45DRAFT_1018503 [Roridomyces roridus]
MAISVRVVEILLCVLPPFACLVTFFRLYLRARHGKLWYDDLWAFLSAIFSIILVLALMLHLEDTKHHYLPNQRSKIIIYYFASESYVAATWAARISILFTVIRLSMGGMRALLYTVAVLFYITWAILLAQTIWVCEKEPGWKQSVIGQCALGKSVGIAQIITDVISDAILIIAPLRLLWGVRLQRALKLRLMAVFTTSAITTVVSLYHDITVLRIGGIPEVIAATIQVAVGLLVANLTVVTAFAFRLAAEDPKDRTPIEVSSLRWRNHSTKPQTTTNFGGLQTTDADSRVKPVQVNMTRTTDDTHWSTSTKPTTVTGSSETTEERPEKMELRDLPTSTVHTV